MCCQRSAVYMEPVPWHVDILLIIQIEE